MFKCKNRILHLIQRHLHNAREVTIPVPWGKIVGKWWGPTDIKPILTMHGYQDNCGTFDRLLPILCENREISFLAIDFPGHGFSSQFPLGMYYDFFHFPLLVRRICNYFNWSTVSLMGHSIGAMTSFSYTLFYPEAVKFLICIDAIHLIHAPISAENLRKTTDDFLKYENQKEVEDTIAFTLEELTQKITSAHNNSVRPEFATYLLRRNIKESKKFPGKFYFSRDPLLKLRLFFHWPNSEIIRDINRVTHPIFISKTKGSSYFEPESYYYNVLEELKKSSDDCDFHSLDGTHHLHLNEPEKIGILINNFLDRHYEPESCNVDHNIFN